MDLRFFTRKESDRNDVQFLAVDGLGLVELMVALTIVSIASLVGFSLFLSIQQATIRSQVQSKEVAAAGQANDKMFLAFGDNDTFFSGAFLTFQPDDTSKIGTRGNVSVTRLFGDENYMSRETGYTCFVDSVGTDNLTIEHDCLTGGGSVADMVAALVHDILPTIVLVEGQEACVVAEALDNGSHLIATVRNPDCLKSASGDNATVNSGVMLPRLISRSDSHESVVSSVLYDFHAVGRKGAGVNFGLANQFRQADPMMFQIATVDDITTSSQVDSLTEADFRYLARVFNPLGSQDAFLRIVVDNGTATLPSLFPTAVTDIVIDGLGTASEVDGYLDNLSVQATSEDISLRFYLSTDNLMWVRTLTIDGS